MQQQSVTTYSRFSPIAIGAVLLLVLAALAMRAHAEEGTSAPVRDQLRQVKEDRGALFEQNKEERKNLLEQNKEEREAWRASSTGKRTDLFEENKEERRALFEENKGEREAWRASSTRAMHEAFASRRDEIKSGIEARREEFKQQHADRKARLASTTQERLGEHVQRISERMNSILDHLLEIADRIESRIDTIEEAKSIELTDARSGLDTARSLITDARKDVADLADLTTEALGSDDPKARMEDVRASVTLAKDSILAVRRALQQAVEAIKASVGSPDEDRGTKNASSSEQEESASSNE